MIDPTHAIDTATKVFDDVNYSRGEAETDRTERLKLDMQSDSRLSKTIRPLATLILLINNVILSWLIIVMLYFGKDVTGARDILMTNAALLGMAISWYFYSKRNERITDKKVKAAVELEKLKTRHQIREDKKESRHERKQEIRNK